MSSMGDADAEVAIVASRPPSSVMFCGIIVETFGIPFDRN